jgi:hypothetical protein
VEVEVPRARLNTPNGIHKHDRGRGRISGEMCTRVDYSQPTPGHTGPGRSHHDRPGRTDVRRGLSDRSGGIALTMSMWVGFLYVLVGHLAFERPGLAIIPPLVILAIGAGLARTFRVFSKRGRGPV